MADGGAGPRIVGRYALFDAIASGGMASVHLGRLMGPVGFSRTVAIKRLHETFATDPEFVAMFMDEARLAARIRHPNVVPTLDVVALERELLLVMEYVSGESLSLLLKRARTEKRPTPIPVVVDILIDTLSGLHAAHEATNEKGEPLDIVHRDVSPQNILVGTDGVARLLDFGVAKAVGRMHETRAGQVKGKIRYMAPEQITGKGVTRTADIYAASIVLWEAVTGKRLFTGDTDAEVMFRVLEGKVDPPSRHRPDVPRALDEIILRGLSPKPSDRFATAQENGDGPRGRRHGGSARRGRGVGRRECERRDPQTEEARRVRRERRGDRSGGARREERRRRVEREPHGAVGRETGHGVSLCVVRARNAARVGGDGLRHRVRDFPRRLGALSRRARASCGGHRRRVRGPPLPHARSTGGAPRSHRRRFSCSDLCPNRGSRRHPLATGEARVSLRRPRAPRAAATSRRSSLSERLRKDPMIARCSLAVTAICALCFSRAAAATPASEADALFQKGLEAMHAGAYANACPLLQESYRLDPVPGALFTVAECEAAWGKLEAAVGHYQKFLDRLPSLPPERRDSFEERRKIALEKMDALILLMPELTIAVPPAAAADLVVTRNGVVVETSSYGVGQKVDPGPYVIAVRAAGANVWERRLTLAERDRARVEIPWPVTSDAPPAVPPPRPPAPAAHSARRTGAYIAGGIGIVGLATGTIAGVVALTKKSGVDANCVDLLCNTQGESALSSGKTAATISTVAFPIGLVASGIAAFLFVTSAERTDAVSTSTARLTPFVGATPHGAMAAIGGAF